jgi:hypothetical protein
MIDAVKDYLAAKRFGIVAYVCVIVHFLCGLVFTAVAAALRASENGKLSCSVDAKSTATYKKQVDQVCFARYDQAYNSPLPLYGFVLLSIGLPVLVSVIYSLLVWKRVDEIESSYERQTEAEHRVHGQNRIFYVFYRYFIHLVVRSLFGIIFTVVQHTYFYPNGFDMKFNCNLPPAEVTSNINTPKNASRNLNSTSVNCENATASEKWLWGIIVSVINSIVALIILVEVIYLLPRLPMFNSCSGVGWGGDSEFVIKHLLGKPYNVPGENEPLTSIENNPPDCSTRDYSTPDSVAQACSDSIQHSRIEYCINFYKQKVLNRCRAPDINYGPKACLDDFYIDVVIHTERARHKFSKGMQRHEIYDVYMEVPPTSIRLEKIKDLFHPNEDTEGNFPRSILAIGRPGIGKTVLTEKLLRDWANEINNYYSGKIVFFFKFKWFNINNLQNLSLKTFLQFGTGLSDEGFESIYEEIAKEPQKAILIFDGLDEHHGNPIDCLDQSRIIPDDPNTCMPAMNLFIKLVLGNLLKGATVLVTSRPTADDFYSRLDFDRNVEIIGFTSDKIEEYVSRFCDNNNTSDLKTMIWNHIGSSSELLNLCYIPVNCFIVCVTLSGCLSDPKNETGALPTTLTELYQTAVNHFEKYHYRNADGNPMTKVVLKKLQRLAFSGMENGQLIFDQELFDEQMKKSGLLNSLSNPIFPIQTQFCFIHLTIQEFLAARHVIETLAPVEINEFISDHVGSGKWHLVLQFIAGLLGKKIKMFHRDYIECVSAFAKNCDVIHGKHTLNVNQVLVMKCLREVDDEEIIKDVCETTAMNDVVKLRVDGGFHPSDIAAVMFVCKHMKNLTQLYFRNHADCFREFLELLQKRCINILELMEGFRDEDKHIGAGPVFSALMKSQCTLNHKHTNLTFLMLHGVLLDDPGLSNMHAFFENGHAKHLEKFHFDLPLSGREGMNLFGISKLCEVINNEYCPELTYLDLGGFSANVMYNALTNKLCELTELKLHDCSLTDQCIPTLCKALQDERCQLTGLSLQRNYIATGDEGVGMLVENSWSCIKEYRKFTKFMFGHCPLIDECIPNLCKALQDEHCQLTVLSLGFNAIDDEEICMFFEDALTKEHCKLTELNLRRCSLTDQCIPSLCKALQDERCQLTDLSLGCNAIGDRGACMLFEDALTKEHCKLTELNLRQCSLTDQCIPSLCMALKDEHCQLSFLSMWGNFIGDKGVGILFEDALTKEHCKLTELNVERCSLTDQCIPAVCKALQDDSCGLTKLHLGRNNFSHNGKRLLCDAEEYQSCKNRGLIIYFVY